MRGLLLQCFLSLPARASSFPTLQDIVIRRFQDQLEIEAATSPLEAVLIVPAIEPFVSLQLTPQSLARQREIGQSDSNVIIRTMVATVTEAGLSWSQAGDAKRARIVTVYPDELTASFEVDPIRLKLGIIDKDGNSVTSAEAFYDATRSPICFNMLVNDPTTGEALERAQAEFSALLEDPAFTGPFEFQAPPRAVRQWFTTPVPQNIRQQCKHCIVGETVRVISLKMQRGANGEISFVANRPVYVGLVTGQPGFGCIVTHDDGREENLMNFGFGGNLFYVFAPAFTPDISAMQADFFAQALAAKATERLRFAIPGEPLIWMVPQSLKAQMFVWGDSPGSQLMVRKMEMTFDSESRQVIWTQVEDGKFSEAGSRGRGRVRLGKFSNSFWFVTPDNRF